MSSKADIVQRICEALLRDDPEAARAVAAAEYPLCRSRTPDESIQNIR
jgi:hypothetical protein